MILEFLGHQGWKFESDEGYILLDPLVETIGNGKNDLLVWPNRRIKNQLLEKASAVVISHEHSDHFSLNTIELLPRSIPIYIPDISSLSLHDFLIKSGFKVTRYSAFVPFEKVGIQFTPLAGTYNILEYDVYPLLIKGKNGATFLTSIDADLHPNSIQWINKNCPTRTLDNFTNNSIEQLQVQMNGNSNNHGCPLDVNSRLIQFVKDFNPTSVLISGQGWCYPEELDKFNHIYFTCQNDQVLSVAKTIAPNTFWETPAPGDRFQLSQFSVEKAGKNETDFIHKKITARDYQAETLIQISKFLPWTNILELSQNRHLAVQKFIEDKYGDVFAGQAIETIGGLINHKSEQSDLLSSIGIILKNGIERLYYSYDLGLRVFKKVDKSVCENCVIGFEIWSSDFESMIDCSEEAFLIYESTIRFWNRDPEIFSSPIQIELFLWFTPTFRPQDFLNHYISRSSKN